jgi:hypothetical protein
LLLSTFKGRNLDETQFFLQMSVDCDRSRRLLVLRQQRHVDQLVQASGLSTACPKSLPMIVGIYVDPIGEEITDPAIVLQYASLVAAVMNISNFTRPDVAFAVSCLARFMNRPTVTCFKEFGTSFAILKVQLLIVRILEVLLPSASCMHAVTLIMRTVAKIAGLSQVLWLSVV